MAESILLIYYHKSCSDKKSQIVQRLLAHMSEDARATRQLHCQWRCGPFHAKRAANAAITFYDF